MLAKPVLGSLPYGAAKSHNNLRELTNLQGTTTLRTRLWLPVGYCKLEKEDLMSTHDPLVPSRSIDPSKPLARVQEYLVAAKECVVLIQEFLLALKDMLFTAALIISFVWMAISLIKGLHP
jgi:hypothetical protein